MCEIIIEGASWPGQEAERGLALTAESASGPVPAISTNQLRFLLRLLAERPRARRGQGLAGQICTTFQIGRHGAHSSIHYDDHAFSRAEALLALGGHRAPQPEPKPVTRLAALPTAPTAPALGRGRAPAPRAKGPEIERPLSPALSKVAVRPLDMGFELPEGTEHLTMSWEAATRLHFGLVLLCDTLSCLGRLHEYRWIRSRTRGRPTLVLYSGQAGGIYRTEAVRRLLARSGAPVVALVPFDPSGLAKAAATPRLETLALPDLAVVQKLTAHGTYDGDFALQVRRHRGQLDQAKHPEVAALWAAMQQLGNGVPISSFGLVA